MNVCLLRGIRSELQDQINLYEERRGRYPTPVNDMGAFDLHC